MPIRCAFGDFAVEDGVMTARALAFDTTDTIIVGEGTVSLRDETLDLELRPRPKDRSILTLRSPLVAKGTFKDPSFRPDFARLGLRGAIALGTRQHRAAGRAAGDDRPRRRRGQRLRRAIRQVGAPLRRDCFVAIEIKHRA